MTKPLVLLTLFLTANPLPSPNINYGEEIFCFHKDSQNYVSLGPKTIKLKNNSSNLPAESFTFDIDVAYSIIGLYRLAAYEGHN